jgi:hypothetical protein
VEQALEAGEVASLATAVAYWHTDADLLANRVGFAIRNLLADGASNLANHFLAFITAGRDLLLFDHFTGNLLGNLHRANFFAWFPHLDGVGAARNGFLYGGVLRQQALQLGAEVEVLVTAARIVAGVATAVAAAVIGITACVAVIATAVDANLLADSVARISALFADPFAAANLDLLLFPNGIANDPLAFDFFGLMNRLADPFADFLHDRFVNGLVAGAGPLFGHSLPLVFVTYLGGTTGVRSRGTSHDGGSATAAATVSLGCGAGTEDSQYGCYGRGKELQTHLSALLCGETTIVGLDTLALGLTSALLDTPTCSSQSCASLVITQNKHGRKAGDLPVPRLTKWTFLTVDQLCSFRYKFTKVCRDSSGFIQVTCSDCRAVQFL